MKQIFKIILSISAVTIIILGVAFYWFQWRPTQIRKECFNKAADYKDSIIKTENNYIDNYKLITRADYEDIFNDTYQECLLGHGLKK